MPSAKEKMQIVDETFRELREMIAEHIEGDDGNPHSALTLIEQALTLYKSLSDHGDSGGLDPAIDGGE